MTRWLLLGQTIQQLWEIWLQSLAEQPTWGQHFLIFFSPVIFPIWGENSGSEKSKKFSSESGFPPCIDLWNSSICSNVLHTLLHTLLAADKRTPPHHLWELLLKNVKFSSSISDENPLGVMIFPIFWFRKSPLDMGSWLVLKKISSDNINNNNIVRSDVTNDVTMSDFQQTFRKCLSY